MTHTRKDEIPVDDDGGEPSTKGDVMSQEDAPEPEVVDWQSPEVLEYGIEAI